MQDSRSLHLEGECLRIGPGDPVLHTACIGVPGPNIGEGGVGVGADREGGLCAGCESAIAVADAVDLRPAGLFLTDTDGEGVRSIVVLTGAQVIIPARLTGVYNAEIAVVPFNDVVTLSQENCFVVIELAVGISRGAVCVEVVHPGSLRTEAEIAAGIADRDIDRNLIPYVESNRILKIRGGDSPEHGRSLYSFRSGRCTYQVGLTGSVCAGACGLCRGFFGRISLLAFLSRLAAVFFRTRTATAVSRISGGFFVGCIAAFCIAGGFFVGCIAAFCFAGGSFVSCIAVFRIAG